MKKILKNFISFSRDIKISKFWDFENLRFLTKFQYFRVLQHDHIMTDAKFKVFDNIKGCKSYIITPYILHLFEIMQFLTSYDFQTTENMLLSSWDDWVFITALKNFENSQISKISKFWYFDITGKRNEIFEKFFHRKFWTCLR